MVADIDAERNVLGAMMQDSEAVHKAIPILGESPSIFAKESHKAIYGAMLRVYRRGDPIDIYILTVELKRTNDLERAGSLSYLYEIQESAPSALNVEFYAEIVKDKALRRSLVEAGNRIAVRSSDDSVSVVELVDYVQRTILEIGNSASNRGFVDMDQALHETMEYIDHLRKNKGRFVGIPTGYLELDRLLSGMAPSELIILAARPSMGKSAFAHNICAHVAFMERKPVAVFSLEMNRMQIITRMLSMESRVDMQRIRTGEIDSNDWDNLCEVVKRLESAPLFINDTPGMSIMDIRSESRRLKMRHKDLALIVVDYLQLIRGGSEDYQNREQEISYYSRSLKDLARELDVAVLALSQLNRSVETRSDKRPQLSDLRESGAIEQDADVVMFLYRDEYYNPDSDQVGKAEVIIKKQRNGPLGTVVLNFNPEFLSFEENSPI